MISMMDVQGFRNILAGLTPRSLTPNPAGGMALCYTQTCYPLVLDISEIFGDGISGGYPIILLQQTQLHIFSPNLAVFLPLPQMQSITSTKPCTRVCTREHTTLSCKEITKCGTGALAFLALVLDMFY